MKTSYIASCLVMLIMAHDLLSNCCDSCGCHSVYIPQSTGANLAREMFDPTLAPTTLFDDTSFAFRAVLEGEKSIRNVRIADCLFESNTLNLVGEMQNPNAASARFTRVILGENLGLSSITNQSITFCPSISNIILDLQFLWQCDVFLPGLFLNVNIPITFTRWRLNTKCNPLPTEGNAADTDCGATCGCCEPNRCSNKPCACITPEDPIPAGCVASSIFPFPDIGGTPTTPATNTTEALSGNFLFGDMRTPWQFGKFRLGECRDTKVADIDILLGYNFVSCEDYHFGVYAQAIAPTGTRLNRCFAEFLFTPVIGNGHLWEFGGGITTHWDFWQKGDCHQLSWWLQGNITHAFSDCQVRSFDFKNNGCLSRYMLLKEFNAQGLYAGQLINAINFTTRYTDVSVKIKGNFALKLLYTHLNWHFGLGYELYAKSAETLCIKRGFVDSSLEGRRFGIKGCSPVQGQVYFAGSVDNNVISGLSPSTPFSINGTQSNATIGTCGNTDNALTLLQLQTSPVDFGAVVIDPCANTTEVIVDITELGDVVAAQGSYAPGAVVVVSNVDGSLTVDGTPAPVILTGLPSELDCDSARSPKQVSNKIFGTFDYIWQGHCNRPFVGIAAEGTFGQADDCCVLNKWGMWVRGGFSW